MHERLDTPRLVGSALAREHFGAVLALYNDSRVARWLGGPRSQIDWLEDKLAHWREHGYGEWVFHERDGEALVGRAGLRGVTIDERAEVELGYMVDADRWSRGFRQRDVGRRARGRLRAGAAKHRRLHAAGERGLTSSDGEVRADVREADRVG